MRSWLREHHLGLEVHEALVHLEKENIADAGNGAPRFSLTGDLQGHADSAAEYCLWLMDHDRKTTPLKTIQGLIWQEGYKRGELQSEVFPDVLASFSEWRSKGCRLAIYSSGSVMELNISMPPELYGEGVHS